MRSSAVKLKWQDKVKHVELFHQNSLRSDSNWTLAKTAKELNYSIGRVSEFLQLATGFKIYPKEMSRFELMSDALKFLKDKNKLRRMGL